MRSSRSRPSECTTARRSVQLAVLFWSLGSAETAEAQQLTQPLPDVTSTYVRATGIAEHYTGSPKVSTTYASPVGFEAALDGMAVASSVADGPSTASTLISGTYEAAAGYEMTSIVVVVRSTHVYWVDPTAPDAATSRGTTRIDASLGSASVSASRELSGTTDTFVQHTDRLEFPITGTFTGTISLQATASGDNGSSMGVYVGIESVEVEIVFGAAGSVDAGVPDSGPAPDLGVVDLGAADAGVSDLGATDAGVSDLGIAPSDSGVILDAGGGSDAGLANNIIPVAFMYSDDFDDVSLWTPYANDGDPSTRFQLSADNVWVAAELESAQTVTGIQVSWYQGDSRSYDFQVEGAGADGVYHYIGAYLSSGTTADFETYLFPAAVEYLELRMTVRGSATAPVAITDIRVLGPGGSPPTDAGVSTDAGTSPDAGSAADAGVPLDSGVVSDSGIPPDSGSTPDAGMTFDTGLPSDAGITADAGVVPDSGTFADAGIVLDAGPADLGPDDMGSLADSGSPSDVGPSDAGATTYIPVIFCYSDDFDSTALWTPNACDGDLATRFQLSGDYVWMGAELNAVSSIAGIEVAWYEGDMRTYAFELSVLDSATGTLVPVMQAISSGTTTGFERYYLPSPRTTGEILITVRGSVTAPVAISELRVVAGSNWNGSGDAGTYDIGFGTSDSGVSPDAGVGADAGTGTGADGGFVDAGGADAGFNPTTWPGLTCAPDAGSTVDAGTPDFGSTDGGRPISIMLTGQSLAAGGASGTPISTSPPSGLNVRDLQGDQLEPLQVPDPVYSFEAPHYGMGYTTAALLGRPVITHNSARGGLVYADLGPGNDAYLDLLEGQGFVTQRLGSTNLSTYLTVIHGEHDSGHNTHYDTDLQDWRTWTETDLACTYGSGVTVDLVTDQMSVGFDGEPTNPARMEMAFMQLAASRLDPDIYLVGPKYQYDYVDTAHLSASSYLLLGSQFGKVISRIESGQGWRPLEPISLVATSSGAAVDITFAVPAPPIVLDTATFAQQTNYGFSYRDTQSGTPPTITGVSVTSPTTIRITLSSAARTGAMIGYAAYATADIPGHTSSSSPYGNVRDSDATNLGPHNPGPAYNWLVHFEDPITGL